MQGHLTHYVKLKTVDIQGHFTHYVKQGLNTVDIQQNVDWKNNILSYRHKVSRDFVSLMEEHFMCVATTIIGNTSRDKTSVGMS